MSEFVVTGGRDFKRERFVFTILNLFPISKLYVGDAKGLDATSREWGFDKGIVVYDFKAEWDQHGKAAGPIRNRQMLEKAKHDSEGRAILIAFPGGRGTENCVRTAKDLGFIIIRVEGFME